MKKNLLFILLIFLNLSVLAQQTLPKIVSCGVSDEKISPQIQQLMKNLQVSPTKNSRQQAESLREMRVWVVVDSTIYGFYKQDIDQIKTHIAFAYQQANMVFEKEVGVHLNVVAIEVLKKGKNYTFEKRGVSDVFGQFGNFQNDYSKRTDVKRDLNVLWTRNTGEPYAGVSSGSSGSTVPGYQHDTGDQLNPYLILHETGHNLGSPHTHNCYWKGGPIDACNDPEGGTCYAGVKTANTGTIMSYCSRVGIGGNETFHPLCIELMKSVMVDQLKLVSMAVAPSQKTTLLSPINKQDNVPPLSYFSWNTTEQTTNYQIQISDKPDFSVVLADTTISHTQLLLTHTLARNVTHYWRVRPLNEVGAGAWSEIFNFKPQVDLVLPKPIVYEVNNLRPYEDQILAFSPIPNTKEYEIAFHNNNNSTTLTEANQYKSFKIKKTQIRVGDFLTVKADIGTYRWRVRALTDSLKGEWSDDDGNRNSFYLYNKMNTPTYTNNYFSVSAYSNPTTFPLAVSNNFSFFDDLRKYKIELADNTDFKNIIAIKEVSNTFLNKPNAIYNQSVIIDGLLPDKKYYYRVNAKTRIDSANSAIGEFKTGTEERWKLSSYQNNTALPQNAYLRHIFIDKDNNKWLYGISGIYVIKTDGSTVTYNTANTNNVLSNIINSITQDSNGRIWAGTDDGLALFENNKWVNYRKDIFGKLNDGGYVWNNTFNKLSSANNAIYAAGNRILRYDGTNWKTIKDNTSNTFYDNSLFNIDSQGVLWTYDNKNLKVNIYENDTWKEVQIDSISDNANASFRMTDNKGKMWFSVYHVDANLFSYFVVSGKNDVKRLDEKIEIVQSLTGAKYTAYLRSFLNGIQVTDKYTYFFGTIGFLEYNGNRYVYYNYPMITQQQLSYGYDNYTTDKNGTPFLLEGGTVLYQFNRNGFNGFTQKQVSVGCKYSFRIGIATPPPNNATFKVFLSDSSATTFKALNATYQDGYINFTLANNLKGIGYRLKYTFGDILESQESQPFDIVPPFSKLAITGANNFCAGKNTNLTVDLAGGKEPYTYEWSQGGSILKSYTTANEGTYTVTVKDADGCIQTTPAVNIKSIPLPKADITYPSDPALLCMGDTFSLNIIKEDGVTYQWKKDTINIVKAIDPMLAVSQSGKYTLLANRSNCLTTSNTVNVIFNEKPVATVSGVGTIYQGESGMIKIDFTSIAPWSFKFSDGKDYTATQTPYSITVIPKDTNAFVITSLSNKCGIGTSVGVAKFSLLTPLAIEPLLLDEPILLNTAPNPFSISCLIKYGIPKPMQVKLSLYDMQGTQKAILVDDYESTGWHSQILNSKLLSSGTYLLTLEVNNKILTQKVILVNE